MKKYLTNLKNITISSVAALVAYIVLYMIWGAILAGVEDKTLKFLLVAIMSASAYSFILLYVSKIRRENGDKDILKDYPDGRRFSFASDVKLVLRREKECLLSMCAVILVCAVISLIDNNLFEKRTLSFLTFPFAPMMLFTTAFKPSWIGYIVSAFYDCISYTIMVVIYRRKKYTYWYPKRE